MMKLRAIYLDCVACRFNSRVIAKLHFHFQTLIIAAAEHIQCIKQNRGETMNEQLVCHAYPI